MVAFIDEGSKSEGFSLSPTDSLTSLDSSHSFLVNFGNRRMEFTVHRKRRDLLSDISEMTQINTGILNSSISCRVLYIFPSFILPFLNSKLMSLGLDVGSLKVGIGIYLDLVKSGLVNALRNELSLVDIFSGLHVLYNFVSKRRGERGVIKLVVTELTVSNKVNHYVLFELLAVLCGNTENLSDGFHIISIDVEDRSVDHLSDIRRVGA
jgi:hypothetical protein